MGALPYSGGMRRILVIAAATALVLAGAALATPGSLSPVLRLGPAGVVRGSHFKAHELVHVVFTAGVRHVRVIRVGAAGSFAAILPATVSCSTLWIRATGSSGDAASIASSTALCPPAGVGTSPPATGGTQTLPDPHGPPTVDPGGN